MRKRSPPSEATSVTADLTSAAGVSGGHQRPKTDQMWAQLSHGGAFNAGAYMEYVRALNRFSDDMSLSVASESVAGKSRSLEALYSNLRPLTSNLTRETVIAGQTRGNTHNNGDTHTDGTILHLLSAYAKAWGSRDMPVATSKIYREIIRGLVIWLTPQGLRELAAVKGADGSSALHTASSCGASHIVERLITVGCFASEPHASTGRLPVQLALDGRFFHTAHLILDASNDPNLGNSFVALMNPSAAVLHADRCDRAKQSVIEHLLARIGDPHRVPFDFYAALHQLLSSARSAGDLKGPAVDRLLTARPDGVKQQIDHVCAAIEPFRESLVDERWIFMFGMLQHGATMFRLYREGLLKILMQTLARPVGVAVIIHIIDSYLT
jgi:hypothetical protein